MHYIQEKWNLFSTLAMNALLFLTHAKIHGLIHDSLTSLNILSKKFDRV